MTEKVESGGQTPEQEELNYEADFDSVVDEQLGMSPSDEDEDVETKENNEDILDSEVDDDAEVHEDDTEDDDDPEQGSSESDWYDSLGDVARDHFSQLEQALRLAQHKERSREGRVSGLQKKINQLQKDLAQAQQQAVASKPTEKERVNLAEQFKDELSKLEEDFPQQAALNRKILEAISKQEAAGKPATETATSDKSGGKSAGTKQPPNENAASVDLSFKAAQMRELDKEVSNWRDIVNHEFFGEFYETLSPAKQQQANSPYASDVIDLLRTDYARYHAEVFPGTGGGDQSKTRTQNTDSSARQSPGGEEQMADKVRQRREKALQNDKVTVGTGKRARNPDANPSGTDAYDREFERYVERLAKSNALHY